MTGAYKKHSVKPSYPAQALMEAALIIPILLFLILGAMDFGRIYYAKMVISNAAREGASYYATSSVCKTSCTFVNCSSFLKSVVVESGASSGVTVVDSEISLPSTCATTGANGSVTVTKSVTFMYYNFLSSVGLVSGPLTLTSTVSMVVQ
jgi:Flp pilus assembly protein TadG